MIRSVRAKRLVDVCGAAVLLAVGLVPMAVVALAVHADVGRPVLFVQERPGLGGRPFRLYKFRTMRDARDERGRPLPDEQRLTRLGRWLRDTSLDELPEVFNVLRGDMALVGPRPLLMAYLERYTPEQARRHEVRPGITGFAQVEGRNALDWERKLALDVWYVDHWTLALDARILARTLVTVLRRAGVSQPGHATVEEFRGSAAPLRRSVGPPATGEH